MSDYNQDMDDARARIRSEARLIDEIAAALKALGIPAGDKLFGAVDSIFEAERAISKAQSEAVSERFSESVQASNNMMRAAFAMAGVAS